jgi:hypothetical protein
VPPWSRRWPATARSRTSSPAAALAPLAAGAAELAAASTPLDAVAALEALRR